MEAFKEGSDMMAIYTFIHRLYTYIHRSGSGGNLVEGPRVEC